MQLQLASPGFESLWFVTCTMPRRSAKISWVSCIHLDGHFWKFLRKHCFASWLPIFTSSQGKIRYHSLKWSKGNFQWKIFVLIVPAQSPHTQLKAENDKCHILANTQHLTAGETAVSCQSRQLSWRVCTLKLWLQF